MKRTLSLLLALGLVLSLGVTSISAAPAPEAGAVLLSAPRRTPEPNIQTYTAEDGEHTIYWTQGITPPRMSSDPDELGTPGFFERVVDVETYVTYQYPNVPGNGYYDLNKNDQHPQDAPQCYLASSVNMLHWWLEQNRVYVEEYLSHLIADDGVYEQHPELHPLLPYDSLLWSKLLASPTMGWISNSYGQELSSSPLLVTVMGNYLNRNDGYWMDRVLDFFFNGYQAQDGEYPPTNDPKNFIPDARAGFFYPVFGPQPLSRRMIDGPYSRYQFLRDNLSRYLMDGYGIMISYYIGTGAHAVSLWGAEYDASGELVRVFITDSNDTQTQSYLPGYPNYARGIHSMDVHRTEGGGAFLSNNTDPNADPGGPVRGFCTLDLAQDLWEKKLSDLSAPQEPSFAPLPEEVIYPVGATAEPFNVQATVNDTGFLTYQWYRTQDPSQPGEAIVGQKDPQYTPDTGTEGVSYYYCQVDNLKNGKIETALTPLIRVEIQDVPLVNAQTPSIRFDAAGVKVDQYTRPAPLQVFASVSDGGTLSYQWYTTNDMSYANSLNILPGETNPTFYPPTNAPGRTFYACVVTNTNTDPKVNGSKTAVAKTLGKGVTVLDAQAENALAPVLVHQPQDLELTSGDGEAVLSVHAKALDGAKLTYQWYRLDDEDREILIHGANGSTLSPDLSSEGVTQYFCRVTAENPGAQQEKTASTDSRWASVAVSGAPAPENGLTLSGRFSSRNPAEIATVVLKSGGSEVSRLELGGSREDSDVLSFSFPDLDPGVYELVISKPVHLPYTISGIVLEGEDLDLTALADPALSSPALVCGDINGDGHVDSTDLGVLIGRENYGLPTELSHRKTADINGDGHVDSTDLGILIGRENYGVQPPVIPFSL